MTTTATPSTKSRPILFSAPMVRAILDGRKTQTRRIVKPQPPDRTALFMLSGNRDPDGDVMKYHAMAAGPGLEVPAFYSCPYGVPGDRLWVRETWGEVAHIDGGNPTREKFVHVKGPDERCIIYREEAEQHGFEWIGESPEDRWRSPLRMPRWASRITLEVTGVRVQRLQDMTEVDAIDEGAMTLPNRPTYEAECAAERAAGRIKPPLGDSPLKRFASLWEQINGAGSWAANPWVWVIEFKRI